MELDFKHHQSAHCESGVTTSLLHHQGLELSEAMIFGIGGGYFFSYMPFLKVYGLPMMGFRHLPGRIFKKATQRLGIPVKQQRFRLPEKSMQALDSLLAEGTPAGLQVGIFWLPFFPPALRFHFNAHNMVVYGKREDHYLISDPVFDSPVECQQKDLLKARYAKGFLAPKGLMYYPLKIPAQIPLKKAVLLGLKDVCSNMLTIPLPFFGAWGIKFFAHQVRRWPSRWGDRKSRKYLGHAIRMQEEIGTGGAGFRFIFGAFLQEVSTLFGQEIFAQRAKEITEIGDRWREFALIGARICKGRNKEHENFDTLSDILLDCAIREKVFFQALHKDIKTIS